MKHRREQAENFNANDGRQEGGAKAEEMEKKR